MQYVLAPACSPSLTRSGSASGQHAWLDGLRVAGPVAGAVTATATGSNRIASRARYRQRVVTYISRRPAPMRSPAVWRHPTCPRRCRATVLRVLPIGTARTSCGSVATVCRGLDRSAAALARRPAAAAAAATPPARRSRAGPVGGRRRQGRRDPARTPQSSPRWETNDRPRLQKAFDAAGVESRHPERRQGRHASSATICDAMINQGVNVLMIVNLDSDSGAACLKKAKDAGITTHRLRPPHAGRSARTTTSPSTTSRSASCRATA